MYNSDPDVYRKQLMKIEIELTSQLLELCNLQNDTSFNIIPPELPI